MDPCSITLGDEVHVNRFTRNAMDLGVRYRGLRRIPKEQIPVCTAWTRRKDPGWFVGTMYQPTVKRCLSLKKIAGIVDFLNDCCTAGTVFAALRSETGLYRHPRPVSARRSGEDDRRSENRRGPPGYQFGLDHCRSSCHTECHQFRSPAGVRVSSIFRERRHNDARTSQTGQG